jgi:DNA modification methylase
MTAIKREERIGGQRLILGDCLEVMSLLQFDAICADPPYGISFSRGAGGGGFGKSIRYDSAPDRLPEIKGDDQPFDPAPFLACSVPMILWGANHYADKLPPSDRWLIWDKRRGSGSNDFADCEMAWSNIKGPARVLPHLWNGGLKDSERGIPRVHKTQKAIVVMEWCLGFLPDAKTILDPFMGSGTTLVACQKLGRQGIGIEIDPDYFDIACKRVEGAARQPDLFVDAPVKPEQARLDLT